MIHRPSPITHHPSSIVYHLRTIVCRLSSVVCRLSSVVALLALAALLGAAGVSAKPAPPTLALPGVQPGDWPMYGHDPQRTNTNPYETTIRAANVGTLV